MPALQQGKLGVPSNLDLSVVPHYCIKIAYYFIELNEDQRLNMNLDSVHNEDNESAKPDVRVIPSTTTDNRTLDNPL